MFLMGIDVGTSGSRVLVVDPQGRVVAAATEDHAPFTSPRPGWAEQDPRDWWRASAAAIRSVLSTPGLEAGAIGAVGLSGQMHGAVLLAAGEDVVRPALIWCDQRTDEQCRRIASVMGHDRLIALTANPPLTGFTLPKLLWVRDEEPDRWARVRRVLLPKDYVRLHLTGEYATDAADASGTLLFDVGRRRWSTEMCVELEIDEALLPRALESTEVSGRVSAAGERATGLPAGTPVVAGGGDQSAGAVGMGIVRPGAVSATIGTSGVVFAATDQPARDPLGRIHTCCHAVPGRWHVMGVTQAAGLSLRWFKDRFGLPASAGEQGAYEALCDEASSAPAGSDGVLWAPYLMGERTPHLDPHARAALVGLSASHDRAHIVRAVLEGVAFSLRDTLTIFAELGVPVDGIRLGGGGARSALWRQIQADVYGRPVERVAVEEGAAYGAALLAGVGAGVWASVDAACEAVVRVSDRLAPHPEHLAVMETQYARYRKLYGALRALE